MKQLFSMLYLVTLMSCDFQRNPGNLSAITELPPFNMLLMDSVTLLHVGNIQAGNPILMMYFRPDCPHCQAETESVVNNIEKLKSFRIYLLTGASFNETKNYLVRYHLDQFPNITVGKDYQHSFARLYKPNSIPYMAIYDGQKRLVKIYYGEVPINTIVKSVNLQNHL